MVLSAYLKSSISFHLGYNAGAQLPAGDRARLEEAMSLIPDARRYIQILYNLKPRQHAWQVSAYFPDDINETGRQGIFNFSRQVIIAGAVQRTISTSDPLKGYEYFREIYLRECDRLAETLYVANYRRPEVRRYAFERAGSEFIMAVPGPADTAVGSRITLSQEWR